ncbi:CZB domain-containing protein [Vibrio cholerae]
MNKTSDIVQPSLTKEELNIFLGKCKRDHVTWVSKVTDFVLMGENDIDPTEVKDHTQCRLGKFLMTKGSESLKDHPDFDYLVNTVHPKLHRLGKEIFELKSRAETSFTREQVQTLHDELLDCSNHIIKLLDNMIR